MRVVKQNYLTLWTDNSLIAPTNRARTMSPTTKGTGEAQMTPIILFHNSKRSSNTAVHPNKHVEREASGAVRAERTGTGNALEIEWLRLAKIIQRNILSRKTMSRNTLTV